jgi:undecaprenyl-diphosphatase
MIEFLNNLDKALFLAINGLNSPFFDNFMMMFTDRFIWVPMYLTVLVLLFRSCRWQTALIYTLTLIAAIVLTDQTCATLIRPMVERMRPSNIENEISPLVYIVDGYRGGSYGFPSCHSANSFALAVFIAMFVKRRGFSLFIVGWALLNSYSRLYLGVHYPGDLLVGAIIGSAFGFLCYVIASALENYSQPINCRRDIAAPSAYSRTIFGIHLSSKNLMIAIFTFTLIYITLASAIALA